jgi:hypothetical protein
MTKTPAKAQAFIVRSSVNPKLILCTNGEFIAESLCGPGGYSAKVYKTRQGASSARDARFTLVEEYRADGRTSASAAEFVNSEHESICMQVASWNDPRGFTPPRVARTGASDERWGDAVAAGVITPTTRGWGHRLTPLGAAIVAAKRARDAAHVRKVVAAGLDPARRLSEMTDAEVDTFVAMMRKDQR